MATSPNHRSVGASNLNYFHREFLAPPLLAVAGRARRIHDRLAGYSPVSTVVFSPCTAAIVSVITWASRCRKRIYT